VSFRKSDSFIFILPASKFVWGDAEEKREYHPPSYLKQQGIPYLDQSTYESLRSDHASFPALYAIQPLSMKEASLLFHWDAPQRILGEPPSISADSDVVVGSSEGNHVELLERLTSVLQTQYKDQSLAQLRSLSSRERIISFYLDAAEFIDWNALAFDGSEYRLLLDSKYVIDLA
jgi:hypothetical protein